MLQSQTKPTQPRAVQCVPREGPTARDPSLPGTFQGQQVGGVWHVDGHWAPSVPQRSQRKHADTTIPRSSTLVRPGEETIALHHDRTRSHMVTQCTHITHVHTKLHTMHTAIHMHTEAHMNAHPHSCTHMPPTVQLQLGRGRALLWGLCQPILRCECGPVDPWPQHTRTCCHTFMLL